MNKIRADAIHGILASQGEIIGREWIKHRAGASEAEKRYVDLYLKKRRKQFKNCTYTDVKARQWALRQAGDL